MLCTFYRSKPPTTARDDSLTRAKPLGAAGSSGPLRVALPDESASSKSNKTATVKPFQSPNSKNQNNKAAGGMGDVAAARGNWRPLAMNSSNSNQQQVYFLRENDYVTILYKFFFEKFRETIILNLITDFKFSSYCSVVTFWQNKDVKWLRLNDFVLLRLRLEEGATRTVTLPDRSLFCLHQEPPDLPIIWK